MHQKSSKKVTKKYGDRKNQTSLALENLLVDTESKNHILSLIDYFWVRKMSMVAIYVSHTSGAHSNWQSCF